MVVLGRQNVEPYEVDGHCPAAGRMDHFHVAVRQPQFSQGTLWLPSWLQPLLSSGADGVETPSIFADSSKIMSIDESGKDAVHPEDPKFIPIQRLQLSLEENDDGLPPPIRNKVLNLQLSATVNASEKAIDITSYKDSIVNGLHESYPDLSSCDKAPCTSNKALGTCKKTFATSSSPHLPMEGKTHMDCSKQVDGRNYVTETEILRDNNVTFHGEQLGQQTYVTETACSGQTKKRSRRSAMLTEGDVSHGTTKKRKRDLTMLCEEEVVGLTVAAAEALAIASLNNTFEDSIILDAALKLQEARHACGLNEFIILSESCINKPADTKLEPLCTVMRTTGHELLEGSGTGLFPEGSGHDAFVDATGNISGHFAKSQMADKRESPAVSEQILQAKAPNQRTDLLRRYNPMSEGLPKQNILHEVMNERHEGMLLEVANEGSHKVSLQGPVKFNDRHGTVMCFHAGNLVGSSNPEISKNSVSKNDIEVGPTSRRISSSQLSGLSIMNIGVFGGTSNSSKEQNLRPYISRWFGGWTGGAEVTNFHGTPKGMHMESNHGNGAENTGTENVSMVSENANKSIDSIGTIVPCSILYDNSPVHENDGDEVIQIGSLLKEQQQENNEIKRVKFASLKIYSTGNKNAWVPICPKASRQVHTASEDCEVVLETLEKKSTQAQFIESLGSSEPRETGPLSLKSLFPMDLNKINDPNERVPEQIFCDGPPDLLWLNGKKRRLKACRVVEFCDDICANHLNHDIVSLASDIKLTAAVDGTRDQSCSEQAGAEEMIRSPRALHEEHGLFTGLQFLITGFSMRKSIKLLELIKHNGGAVLPEVPLPSLSNGNQVSISHDRRLDLVIAPRQMETPKYLYGCAIGSAPLQSGWIVDSLKEKQCLPKGRYQHLLIEEAYIFKGMLFLLYGGAAFRSKLTILLQHGGGRVLQGAKSLVSNACNVNSQIIIVESQRRVPCSLRNSVLTLRLPIVSGTWIIRSLLHGRLLPLPCSLFKSSVPVGMKMAHNASRKKRSSSSGHNNYMTLDKFCGEKKRIADSDKLLTRQIRGKRFNCHPEFHDGCLSKDISYFNGVRVNDIIRNTRRQ